MQFTGRLTNNAVVKTTKDERQVVSFSVAINDQYKRKGNDMPIKTVLYINCSYWVNTSIALHLTKGSIVELQGRPHWMPTPLVMKQKQRSMLISM